MASHYYFYALCLASFLALIGPPLAHGAFQVGYKYGRIKTSMGCFGRRTKYETEGERELTVSGQVCYLGHSEGAWQCLDSQPGSDAIKLAIVKGKKGKLYLQPKKTKKPVKKAADIEISETTPLLDVAWEAVIVPAEGVRVQTKWRNNVLFVRSGQYIKFKARKAGIVETDSLPPTPDDNIPAYPPPPPPTHGNIDSDKKVSSIPSDSLPPAPDDKLPAYHPPLTPVTQNGMQIELHARFPKLEDAGIYENTEAGRLLEYSKSVVDALERLGVKVVAFDFDKTLINTFFGNGADRDKHPKTDWKPTPHAEALWKALAASSHFKDHLWMATFQDPFVADRIKPGTHQTMTVPAYKPKAATSPKVATLQCYAPTRFLPWNLLPVQRKLGTPIVYTGAALIGRVFANSGIPADTNIKVMAYLPTPPDTKNDLLARIRDLEEVEPHQLLLIDDSAANIKAAVKHGVLGILVKSKDGKGRGLDFNYLEVPTM